MQERIDGVHLLLIGLGNCQVNDPERTLGKLRSLFPKVQVQLVRADRIAGREHLKFAARNAIRAFRQKNNRSQSLAMELLLYASCQRQISRAIQRLGVSPETREIVLAALTKNSDTYDPLARAAQKESAGVLREAVIEIDSKSKVSELKKAYNIGTAEMEAARFPKEAEEEVLTRLIIERSALLSLGG
jgi:KEOPS complex subunit Cgi121